MPPRPRALAALAALGGAAAQASCASNGSTHCPLPPWPPTYNLSQSSVVYQPWCGGDNDPNTCIGFLNVTAWWSEGGNADKGSDGSRAHWGLISLDWNMGVRLWSGSTYAGATPGNPLTASGQEVNRDDCVFVKQHGWADRCFVYDNMVNSLGWYKTHRDRMLDPTTQHYFNIMQAGNAAGANYTGLPFIEVDGRLTPCWDLPAPNAQEPWCGPLADLRLPCFFRGDCNTTADGASFGFYWNYSNEDAAAFRVADAVAFVKSGGDGVDGMFTDEMELFPGDGGGNIIKIIGTTDADAQAQQAAGQRVHQAMIDGLVAEGKFLWQAMQSGNDVGRNCNNNTVGGFVFDVAYCTQWMSQRCNTDWVNERAITVQFDKFNVNVSIASFLIVRPAYAYIGYGAGYYRATWNDAFLWDVGSPVGECAQTAPGVFERAWTYGTATMDCNSFSASVPCNPADKSCGEPPHPPPPPPGPPGRWSPAHNCTSCGNDASLADYVNLDLGTCQRLCKANPQCSYVTWVVPAGDGQCSLFAECDEQCLTDHCWGWYTTYEYLDRPSGRPWNVTACDSLPEKPNY